MFQKAALFTGKLLFAYIGYLNWLCPLASTTSKVSTREVGWKKQDKTKQNNKQKNIFMGTWIGKWPPLNTRNLFNIDFHAPDTIPTPLRVTLIWLQQLVQQLGSRRKLSHKGICDEEMELSRLNAFTFAFHEKLTPLTLFHRICRDHFTRTRD